ncbi:DNA-binding transcriptional regulator, XRE-family HTH domain [Anaerosporobacter mobilis DSM 15930]|jgi:transcriptional regulator with XRE-family HTH domain|uniref:DNA-binding transcriptional regulator, XRE-family HTH domain n=1 Tax=Anaerosporobacter mobilis DSM 15930 TaxID=1120996 RepID=A0A1M7MZP5_9FIRM|nr:helix-turn-helix transcriptional regulator [Anaerosporobacter mobilis]SHM96129.1 DNA-binding transcriptional regulator, XRE-family HTH domain [Anaerosporobacter mobilis DSM 15930]
MYENYCKLRDLKGLKDSDVARISGITKSTFSDWKNGRSNPKNEKLKKIADCLGTTVDYLMTGKEQDKNERELTPKDERDIAKDLERIMEKLSSGEDGPASYNGEELDPEAAELFRDELLIALRRLKLINKEKYTPKKYKR